jgi:hypothetical protein
MLYVLLHSLSLMYCLGLVKMARARGPLKEALVEIERDLRGLEAILVASGDNEIAAGPCVVRLLFSIVTCIRIGTEAGRGAGSTDIAIPAAIDETIPGIGSAAIVIGLEIGRVEIDLGTAKIASDHLIGTSRKTSESPQLSEKMLF